jgi:hypothetical protein
MQLSSVGLTIKVCTYRFELGYRLTVLHSQNVADPTQLPSTRLLLS